MTFLLRPFVAIFTAFLLAFSPVGLSGTPVQAATVSESGGTDCAIEVDNATDVIVTKVNSDCVVQFKRVGTTTWTVPDGVSSVRYLIVAGGGGGAAPGAGGAGGLLKADSLTVTPGVSHAIVVGEGGQAKGANQGTAGSGGNSSAFGLTAIGGGGGASLDTAAGSGGSGGSRSENNSNNDSNKALGGAGTTGQGNSGGSGGDGGPFVAGGGGGAGGAGANSTTTKAGNGGAGRNENITGATVGYAGGGGGSWYQNATPGQGLATHGGGNGGIFVAGFKEGTSGTANTGGGGGGGQGLSSTRGGDGGSGVVIIRFLAVPKTPQGALSVTSVSGTFPSLTLTTEGGSGDGALSYAVTDGTATGCTISAGALTSTTVGTCLVTATKASDPTYSAVSSAQTTVAMARASRTIAFAASSMTIAYGNTDTVLANPSAGSGDGAVSYSAGDSTACSVNSSSGAVLATSASGTCSITATIAQGTNYLTASTTIPVVVTAATRPLTVSAGSASVNFGTSYTIDALADASSGLSGLDEVSGATFIYTGTGSTTYGPTDVKPVNAGTYSVTASAATFSTGLAANYNITYAAGGITISRVSRTIAFATTSANLTFGSTVTVSATPSKGDGEVTYSTVSLGCSVDNSSGLVTATSNSGSCTISASIAEGTNHLTATTSTPFTVTLAKRILTVTASNVDVTFGDAVNPARELTSGTFAGSDQISGVTYSYAGIGSTVYASSTVKPTTPGTYTITPSAAVFSSGNASNYTVSFLPGTLNITKRPLTIAAASLSITAGQPLDPSFTLSSGSLATGDEITAMTYRYEGVDPTVYASTTEAPTDPGTYSVTPSEAVFSNGDVLNYLVSYSVGTLTITAAASSTSGGVAVVPPAPETVRQIVQLEKLNFTGGALPKKARRDIRAMVRGMDQVTEVVCTAFAGGPGRKPLSRPMARQLATKACALVQRLEPSAIVKIRVRVAGNDETKLRGLRVAQTGR